MNRNCHRLLIVILLCTLVLEFADESKLAAQGTSAQLKLVEKKPASTETKLQAVQSRLIQIEENAAQYRESIDAPVVKPIKQQYPVLVEKVFLGMTYNRSSQGNRFFVAELQFGNPSSKPVLVRRESIILTADDETYPANDVPANIPNYGFQVGQKSYSVRDLKSPKELTIPAGKTASMWAIFVGLPADNDVPTLQVKIQIGEKQQSLDINEMALGVLNLEVDRIGPQDCLAMLTIHGFLNSVSLGNLVKELDRLSALKIARVIIRWEKSALSTDSNLISWLSQVARQAGRGEVRNTQFPSVPVMINELHLAELPKNNSSYYQSNNSGPIRIHRKTYEAVSAALRTAYEILPRDELLKEIQQGDQRTRSAALAIGGGRLGKGQVPIILSYVDGKDKQLQRAALIALKHFGGSKSIEKLLNYVKKNDSELAEVAAESLAGSRYSVAHRALLDLLLENPPESKKMIVKVLARHPQPIWSKTLYQFTKDSNSDVSVEAMRGLVRVGHPLLFDVLKASLNSNDSVRSTAAFQLLVMKSDPRYEEAAIEYALNYLKKSPPTSQIVELLTRTRDRRAVPLLLNHLSDTKKGGNRSTTINLLAQIGDETVVAVLIEQYPKMQKYEKVAVLNVLNQMRSPEFIVLAEPALSSNDSSLVSTACQGLQADGSPRATQMLIKALETSKNQSTWSYTSNALAVIATTEARDALKKARESDNANKKSYANNALRNLRQRSPGYQYVYQGQHYARQKDWKTAIAQYSMALKIDPRLSEAYSGRANAHLELKQNDEARKDFSQAVKLDSYNSQALTGLAVVMALQGEYEKAVKSVETVPKRFKDDKFYAYNSACVYGRAVEHLQKTETIKDRDKKIKTYQTKAITELNRAVKLGFQDFNWMQKDPDLNSLHDLPGFKQIHTPGDTKHATTKPATAM